jgi:hypothetical protein
MAESGRNGSCQVRKETGIRRHDPEETNQVTNPEAQRSYRLEPDEETVKI